MTSQPAEFDFDFETTFGDGIPRSTVSHTDPLRATFTDMDLAPARASLPAELAGPDYWGD